MTTTAKKAASNKSLATIIKEGLAQSEVTMKGFEEDEAKATKPAKKATAKKPSSKAPGK
jgi:hypothetical protein